MRAFRWEFNTEDFDVPYRVDQKPYGREITLIVTEDISWKLLSIKHSPTKK